MQLPRRVMWSETVGHRQDQFETKTSGLVLHALLLVLVLQVWCCVVKHGFVTLAVMVILKDSATFQVLFIVSLFCDYCGVQHWCSLT